MITKVNPYGHISLTNDYFSGLVEQAAKQCYGIAAMGQAPAESVVRSALRTGSLLGNSTKRRDRHAAAGQHPAHLMVLSLAHGHKAAAGAERAEISRAADRSVAQREPGLRGEFLYPAAAR